MFERWNLDLGTIFKTLIAADPQLKYLPLKKYENWSKMLNEIGKMLGGWIKSTNKKYKTMIPWGDEPFLPWRGGNWGNGSNAGLFALYLNGPRSFASASIGFRAAFCSL